MRDDSHPSTAAIVARLTGEAVVVLDPAGKVVDRSSDVSASLVAQVATRRDVDRFLGTSTPVRACWRLGGESVPVWGCRLPGDERLAIVQIGRPSSEVGPGAGGVDVRSSAPPTEREAVEHGEDHADRDRDESGSSQTDMPDDATGRLDEPARELRIAIASAREAQSAARALANRYRSILDNTSSPIARFDQRLTCREANASFADLVGRTPHDVAGCTLDELDLDESVATELRTRLERVMRTAESDRMLGVSFQASGGRRYIDLTVAPERTDDETAGAILIGADVTGRIETERQLVRLATTDPLTGVANRTVLDDRLDLALRRLSRDGRGVALLFIDLDDFKYVNDTEGHRAGDEVLRDVAAGLRSIARETDTVARHGGDEFVVLADDCATSSDAVRLGERVISVLERPTPHDNRPRVSASIGVAWTDVPMSPDALLRNADIAMYEAKRGGKARVALFQDDMQALNRERLRLASELRHGIRDEQLNLHYQPLVDLETEEVLGVEALVRWKHPEIGLLQPSQFLPIATEAGLLGTLGSWVSRTAIAQLARWRAGGGPFRDIDMHVNVAPLQLTDPVLVRELARAIEGAEVPPSSICLEVTEQLLLGDHLASMSARLVDLFNSGVAFALDDFGTGSSSLSHLRMYPISVVKIDQRFVAGITHSPSDRAIVAGVIGLSRGLGLRTIAEGIERPEQVRILRDLGCDAGQGYLWSPPLSAFELEAQWELRRGAPTDA